LGFRSLAAFLIGKPHSDIIFGLKKPAESPKELYYQSMQEKLALQFGRVASGVDFVPTLDDDSDDERIIRPPRMRQRIDDIGRLVREDEERSTSFKELFYDLIFVVVIAHISHDHLRHSPSWTFPILFVSVFRYSPSLFGGKCCHPERNMSYFTEHGKIPHIV
jgi:hypothetical protein